MSGGRLSLTKGEKQAIAAHLAVVRVMRLCQVILAGGGIAGALWSSWHWLFWGAVAVWIFNRAVPPSEDLDKLTGR